MTCLCIYFLISFSYKIWTTFLHFTFIIIKIIVYTIVGLRVQITQWALGLGRGGKQSENDRVAPDGLG